MHSINLTCEGFPHYHTVCSLAHIHTKLLWTCTSAFLTGGSSTPA